MEIMFYIWLFGFVLTFIYFLNMVVSNMIKKDTVPTSLFEWVITIMWFGVTLTVVSALWFVVVAIEALIVVVALYKLRQAKRKIREMFHD